MQKQGVCEVYYGYEMNKAIYDKVTILDLKIYDKNGF
jgi:hypothetical protein